MTMSSAVTPPWLVVTSSSSPSARRCAEPRYRHMAAWRRTSPRSSLREHVRSAGSSNAPRSVPRWPSSVICSHALNRKSVWLLSPVDTQQPRPARNPGLGQPYAPPPVQPRLPRHAAAAVLSAVHRNLRPLDRHARTRPPNTRRPALPGLLGCAIIQERTHTFAASDAHIAFTDVRLTLHVWDDCDGTAQHEPPNTRGTAERREHSPPRRRSAQNAADRRAPRRGPLPHLDAIDTEPSDVAASLWAASRSDTAVPAALHGRELGVPGHDVGGLLTREDLRALWR